MCHGKFTICLPPSILPRSSLVRQQQLLQQKLSWWSTWLDICYISSHTCSWKGSPWGAWSIVSRQVLSRRHSLIKINSLSQQINNPQSPLLLYQHQCWALCFSSSTNEYRLCDNVCCTIVCIVCVASLGGLLIPGVLYIAVIPLSSTQLCRLALTNAFRHTHICSSIVYVSWNVGDIQRLFHIEALMIVVLIFLPDTWALQMYTK